MAIDAHFEETFGAARAPRRRLSLETTGSKGARGASVRVLNISETGALLQTDIGLAIGETIEINLPEAGPVGARVVWSGDRLFGCAFARTLPSHVLSAVRLRAQADGRSEDEVSRDMPQESEGFAERLHRLRKDRGLTQAQLATALGVSKPTVWAWEQGRAKPVAERLDGLAAVLGVTVADLRPQRTMPGVADAVARAREQIAASLGISPERVRVMIDL